MALAEQLGDDSWSVVCAACCPMSLVFAIMHLYNLKKIFIVSVHSFFKFFFSLTLDGMVDNTRMS